MGKSLLEERFEEFLSQVETYSKENDLSELQTMCKLAKYDSNNVIIDSLNITSSSGEDDQTEHDTLKRRMYIEGLIKNYIKILKKIPVDIYSHEAQEILDSIGNLSREQLMIPCSERKGERIEFNIDFENLYPKSIKVNQDQLAFERNVKEELSKLRESVINDSLAKHDGANTEVLGFIFDFSHHLISPASTDTIMDLFSSGYCYHFAMILKDMFGGEVCWLKYRSHIVWYDTESKLCYDIYGVFDDYYDEELIPVKEMGQFLEDFKHRGHDKDLSTEQITDGACVMVNKYEKKMGWEVSTRPIQTD